MTGETAYLSLGSNVGDRAAQLQTALESLRQHPRLSLIGASSVYETDPQDVVDQPLFLNMVAAVETDLTPPELLGLLHRIESEAGRVRRVGLRRGPRPLDLDILLFGILAIGTPTLTIPHPSMTKRRFVLEPLLELNPRLTHPVTGELLEECLGRVGDQSVRRLDLK